MELVAQLREQFRKKVSALRTQGFLPAELYGYGTANLHLSVSTKEFRKVYTSAGENTLVNVSVDGVMYPSLITDVAVHPVSGDPLHADFYRVRMDQVLETKVPLIFTGESPAIKNLGALLVKTVQELPVEALPTDIPRSITVDISSLVELGNSIHVSDLVIPNGVKVLIALKTVVATVKAKMTEEEEAALQAKGAVETVKVEVEEKKEERAAAKEATDAAATPGGAATPATKGAAKPAAKATEKK